MPLTPLLFAARALLRADHALYAQWLLEDQAGAPNPPEVTHRALALLVAGAPKEALAVLDEAAEPDGDAA
jgi:hypothetical protein